MGRRFGFFAAVVAFVAVSLVPLAAQGRDIPKSLVKFTTETLAAIGRDAALVEFVASSNAVPQDVAKLKEFDARWQKKDGIEDFVKALLGNACSARLGEDDLGLQVRPRGLHHGRPGHDNRRDEPHLDVLEG